MVGIAEDQKPTVRDTEPGAPYRGLDRRRSPAPRPLRPLLPMGLMVAGTTLVVVAVAGLGPSLKIGGVGSTAWLTSSVAMVAAVAGAVHAMRWRLVGEAPTLWVAAALLLYGAVSVAFPNLVDSFAVDARDARGVVEVLRPASLFVVVVLLVLAVTAPTVDARLTPRRVAAVAAIAAAGGVLIASLWEGFRVVLGPSTNHVPGSVLGAVGQVGVALVWLVLGLVFLRRSLRPGSGISPWVGTMLLGLGEARVVLALAESRDESWLLASQLFRLFGVSVVLIGGLRELQRSFAQQRAQLLDSLLELGSAEERRRAQEASAEERAHDLHAALAGIGSAAVALERYHAQLTDEERATIANSVSAEIARLQRIVKAARDEPVPFTIADALAPAVVCTAASGVAIDIDIPPDLHAVGRPGEVADVVQNLLDNARRHAPGSSVLLRAERCGSVVQLRVEDSGPGVPPADRQRIFERGQRGATSAEGSGLGLFIAAQLVRDQGGELGMEDRPGGGASFVLTLPGATSSGGDA